MLYQFLAVHPEGMSKRQVLNVIVPFRRVDEALKICEELIVLRGRIWSLEAVNDNYRFIPLQVEKCPDNQEASSVL